jgi:hypothetical protein
MKNLLCDVVRYCFMGDMFSPPASAAEELRKLVSNNSALVLLPNGDKEPKL